MPGMGTTHIKVELFQRPVVDLGQILSGGYEMYASGVNSPPSQMCRVYTI